ncbi:hypothetical protein T069G_04953 [Trichoderma breve]|uniref:Uncharacterized protein n=1 Tax=Trichoderma breve TaxID=2034170 RepID=A0A9W9BGI9_9HYPO|nr:hypothetical protein T069G_04953 [Trichoderma breve]KAJ4859965.1 hypothetical protein T069G_04953 [Trichoderma breve]
MAPLGWIATTAGRYLVTASSGISIYPLVRDGARKLAGDARWAYDYFTSSATESSAPPAATLPTQAPPSTWVLSERGGIGNQMQSLFSATTIVLEIIKMYQAEQIRRELKGIADQLRIHNNLVAGGGGGPDGFARNVLDFFNLKVAEYTRTDDDRKHRFGKYRFKQHRLRKHRFRQHRFFIYHPDTHWHGAFARIRHESGSKQPLLLGLSNDLFAIFRLMLCARVALEAEAGDGARNITFHLLIPSYCTLVIPRSFVILGNLFPLTIDGQIAQGECLVWLNLPRRDGYDRPVLNNVGNLDDLPESSWKDLAVTSATITTATATWMVATPIAVEAVAIACPPLAVPIFLACAVGTALATTSVATAVESAWEEPPPAFLG